MPTLKLVILPHQKRRDGKCPISIRITKDRKSIYIPTGQYIEPKYWNGKVKSNHPEYLRLTHLLQEKEKDVSRKLLDEEIKDSEISTTQLRYRIVNKDKDFLAFAERIKKTYDGRTLKNYTGVINKLREFQPGHIYFDDINYDFLLRFESYLRKKGNNTNTVAGRMSRIKTILNMAYKSGKADRNKNPFMHYKIKTTEASIEWLTEKELNEIRKVDYKDPDVILARDIFLFQFNCWGMRISDALLLKWDNIDSDGRLRYTMFKTDKQVPPIQLSPEAKKIIGKRGEGYVFPVMTRCRDTESATAYINKKLNDVAGIAQIHKKLTTHVARHTWASMAADKISIWKIKEMLGHTNIATTQRYIRKFSSSELNEANKLVIG